MIFKIVYFQTAAAPQPTKLCQVIFNSPHFYFLKFISHTNFKPQIKTNNPTSAPNLKRTGSFSSHPVCAAPPTAMERQRLTGPQPSNHGRRGGPIASSPSAAAQSPLSAKVFGDEEEHRNIIYMLSCSKIGHFCQFLFPQSSKIRKLNAYAIVSCLVLYEEARTDALRMPLGKKYSPRSRALLISKPPPPHT